ncbi:MAG: GNAT family N-acetyltransferase [Pararobbsia sp.]
MLLTSGDAAYQLEMAQATHLTRQIECYARIAGDARSIAFAAGGGIAALTHRRLGRRFNHVAGFAMGTRVGPETLLSLEQSYAQRGLPVEIDLCPHADSSALNGLSVRGYAVRAFSHIYACKLADLGLPVAAACAASGDIEIRIGAPHDIARTEAGRFGMTYFDVDQFEARSIAALADPLRARPRVPYEALAKVARARRDTLLFCASIEGEIAGTAALSLIDSPSGRVAQLYLASTLPAWRGRGVYGALLKARLAVARDEGYEVACLTIDSGEVSARCVERAGLRLAYTRSTFVRYPARAPVL